MLASMKYYVVMDLSPRIFDRCSDTDANKMQYLIVYVLIH